MKQQHPLLTGDDTPFVSKCPTCGGDTTANGDIFSLQGGAHLVADPVKGRPSGRLSGYLMTVMQQSRNGETVNSQNMIVDDVSAGQFNIFFCTPTCMREHLNAIVDQLENQMVK